MLRRPAWVPLVFLSCLAVGACKPETPVFPIARVLLGAGADAIAPGDGMGVQEAQAELGLLTRAVSESLGGGKKRPEQIARGFADALFGQLGFRREIESTFPRHHLLASVLTHRRGSCVGLVSVYLAVAERLGVPINAELVPGHLHLRLGGPDPVYIETLRGGEVVADAFYRDKYIGTRQLGPAYRRPLTTQELLAVVRFNLGNHHREQGDPERAEAEYRAAAEAFPVFAEAHASLGLVLHARGDLAGARAAYAAAARVDAWLPGLAQSLEALDAEAIDPPSMDPAPAATRASPALP